MYGFQEISLTTEEKKKKAKADAINFDIACAMIDKHTEDVSVNILFSYITKLYILIIVYKVI